MRALPWITSIAALAVAGTATFAFGQGNGKDKPTLELTSSEFKNGDLLPPTATCDGESQSPALAWKSTGPTDAARSFVLIVDDPDAPKGTFVHWILFDIPKETFSIPHGGSSGLTGTNSADQTGYFAPCPPNDSGLHHYRFHLYALDTDRLGTSAGAPRTQVETAMKGHVVADALLVGTYERK